MNTAAMHPADVELFDDTLSCSLVLPAQFLPGAVVQRPGSAEMLLRSVALVEDARGSDDGDERGEGSLQLQRLEARLDLALVMLGRVLQQSTPMLDSLPLRWSRHGLCLQLAAASGVAAGSTGVVKLQPAEWLPDSIELPVRVLAEASSADGTQLWLRLDAPGEALAAALERHLFRLHRKQVADARRSR